MARDESDAMLMRKSHKLVKARNYRAGIEVGARGVWNTRIALLDAGVGDKLIKEELVRATWAPLMKEMKESRLRSVSNTTVEVKRIISLDLEKGSLQKKIGFFVELGLATNIIVGTAFIGNKVEKPI